MRGFSAFTKKELTEQIRGSRALILLAVLFVFGMSSPLLAKLMPEIFKSIPIQGVTINVPEPTAADAWTQFFKNIGQMGIIILLLLNAGMLSKELSKGSLILPLSKGLSRGAVILSKFLVSSAVWTVGYAVAVLTGCVYTKYLFGGFGEPRLLFSVFCLWLFGIFLLALLLLASTLAPGSYGGLLLTAGVLCALFILYIFPSLKKWNPVSLSSNNAVMLSDVQTANDAVAAVWVTLSLTVISVTLALIFFRKKKL